ncbi:MAG: hypothetical protein R3F17_11115 [Planctomycetota bacterium]
MTASFNFGGSGGPNGDFDYYVPAGEDVSINTVTASIIGGLTARLSPPKPSSTGLADAQPVRPGRPPSDLRGNNPATPSWRRVGCASKARSSSTAVTATVWVLNTTPEGGAFGNAGGGRGGTGLFLTSSNTPRGGAGYGVNQAGRGGQGGETTRKSGSNVDFRRGAGGGGGALGEDVMFDHDSNAATLTVTARP